MEFTAEQIAEMKAKADRADAAEAEACADLKARTRSATASSPLPKLARRERKTTRPDRRRRSGQGSSCREGRPGRSCSKRCRPGADLQHGRAEPRQALAAFLDGLPKRGPAKGEAPLRRQGEFSAERPKTRPRPTKALAAANAGQRRVARERPTRSRATDLEKKERFEMADVQTTYAQRQNKGFVGQKVDGEEYNAVTRLAKTRRARLRQAGCARSGRPRACPC
jgi:hypothetical protein